MNLNNRIKFSLKKESVQLYQQLDRNDNSYLSNDNEFSKQGIQNDFQITDKNLKLFDTPTKKTELSFSILEQDSLTNNL